MSLKNNNQEDQLIKGLTFSSSLKFKMKQKTYLSVTLNIICVLLMLNLGYMIAQNTTKVVYILIMCTPSEGISLHTFTCYKARIETLEKCVRHVQS